MIETDTELHLQEREPEPAPAHVEAPDALEDAFKELIQTDSTVCNNCFRLVATEQTGRQSIGSLGWFVVRYRTPVEGTTVDAAPQKITKSTVRACNCGEYGTERKRRPLSKERAVEYASNLADTLEAKRVPFDRDVLMADVRERIAEPSTSNREDTHVFAPALARALSVAASRLRDVDAQTDESDSDRAHASASP